MCTLHKYSVCIGRNNPYIYIYITATLSQRKYCCNRKMASIAEQSSNMAQTGPPSTRLPPTLKVSDEIDMETLPPSTELLTYYRKRLREFEQERAVMIKKMNAIEVSHEELHRTQWDLRVRQEEIAELQRALSDANVYLFDEREQVLKLQAENDQLKIQELEDRRRIQHLLALTQPVSQEVTFFRDCRPAKMTRFPIENTKETLRSQADSIMRDPGVDNSATSVNNNNSTLNNTGTSSRNRRSGARRVRRSNNSSNNSTRSARGKGLNMSSVMGGGNNNNNNSVGMPNGSMQPYKNRVLRTIYLPSEKADTLLLTVESLQKQLEAVKELESGRNAALLEDRRKRIEEERVRAAADREQVEALQDTVKRIEEKLRNATKDYLETRHAHQVHARIMKEETEMLRSQNEALVRELQEERRRSIVETESVKTAAEQEAQMYTEQFRREALAREEDLSVLKEQYNEVQKMYKQRVSKLESSLKSMTVKYKQLAHRRQMDFEGYGADVTNLRSQLRKMEDLLVKGTSRKSLRGRKSKRNNASSFRRSKKGSSKNLYSNTQSLSSIIGRTNGNENGSKMMMESVDMVESIPVSSSDGYGSTDVDAIEFYSNNGRKSKPETLENDLVVLRERLANLEGQITNIMNDDEGEEE